MSAEASDGRRPSRPAGVTSLGRIELPNVAGVRRKKRRGEDKVVCILHIEP
jgi:hypothetical protein